MEPMLTVALLPWLLIAALGWLLSQVIRQHGRALLAHDALGERLTAVERTVQELSTQLSALRQVAPVAAGLPAADTAVPAAAPTQRGLPVGSRAPDFALPDLDGRQRTLREFLGRPLLVIFFNTGCGFCRQMAPRLGQVPTDGLRLLLVSRGDPEEHRRLAQEHGWRCDVVLEPGWEVAGAYGATGTPMGYLLDAKGRIASHLAAGADAVLALPDTRPANPSRNGHAGGLTAGALREQEQAVAERARAAGLPIRESALSRRGLAAGTTAPDFQLPDLDGRQRTLAEFRGRPVLLVFSDPDCGPCQALAPQLVGLQAQRADQLQVLLVSRGELAENRDQARAHRLTFPVLLQQGWRVSKEYAMFATPVAYLIDARGTIVDDVAVGGDAILQLAREVAA